MDKIGRDPRQVRGARRSDAAIQHRFEQYRELHAGQVGAETEVGPAAAEGDLCIVGSADVELLGPIEHRLVPIGRRVPHDDLVACGDLGSGQFGVHCGGSSHVQDRRRPADDLLHGVGEQIAVRRQPVPLLGVLGEGDRPVGDCGARRFIAAEYQDLEKVAEFGRSQTVAADLGVHEVAYDVVSGVVQALVAELRAVLVQPPSGRTPKGQQAQRRGVAVGIRRQ